MHVTLRLLTSCLVLLAGPSAFADGQRVVYTFDARPLNQLNLEQPEHAARLWDILHTISALQGLANRKAPNLYLFYCSEFGVDTDQFWFDWARTEDGWIKDAEIRPLAGLTNAVAAFGWAFKGLVVYDPAVPSTANLASTSAGCDELLPVRYDTTPGSAYDLLARQMQLPVKLWLVNPDGNSKFTGTGSIPDFDEPSSGSAKVDCYRWAFRRYLHPGRCAPGIAAYYVDAFWQKQTRKAGPTMHTLSNHDFFIARQAFFFDLSPWADEAPNDDPGQSVGLDRKAFLTILGGLYEQAKGSIIRIGGFPPWPFKYTSHASPQCRHEGVPTEWEFTRLISQFNAYKEADAAGLGAIANASFFQHYPLASRYPQPNPKPAIADWRNRGLVTTEGKVSPKFYLGHYVGDYDAPSWLYKAVPRFFRDPARGKVPLGWAFNPNLADRSPQAMVYARRHATSNDFFIAGDSGAGYLNPRALTVRPESGLPSGLQVWVDYCWNYYQRWDLTITGFILDGAGGASTKLEFEAYRKFSPEGAGTHFESAPAVLGGIPTCPERDLPDNVNKAAEIVAQAAHGNRRGPGFFWARSILKSPAWYAELSQILDDKHPELGVTVVDPYTFFGLIRLHHGEGH